jgi:hypothetical protein
MLVFLTDQDEEKEKGCDEKQAIDQPIDELDLRK